MGSTVWSGTQAFTVPAAAETVVPIRVPHRGILRGYALAQTTGAASGFTAALYTSNQETAPNSELPANVFHLTNLADIVNNPSGVVALAENNNLNLAYLNRDGNPTSPQRFLYLRITPAGTGNKNFALTVTIETPALR